MISGVRFIERNENIYPNAFFIRLLCTLWRDEKVFGKQYFLYNCENDVKKNWMTVS